jgi:WD40 repeat protein
VAFGGIAFSPDGRRLATSGASFFDLPIRLWDVDTGKELLVIRTRHLFWSLAFLPDGKRLAAAGPNATVLWDVTLPEMK